MNTLPPQVFLPMTRTALPTSPNVVPMTERQSEPLTLGRADVLARTKLRPPRLRDRLMDRAGLLDSLESSLTSVPVTLLVAPAGFGKTTVMAGLARRIGGSGAAWASLDSDDVDRSRFLTVLVEALRQADPRCGAAIAELLAGSGGQLPAHRRLLDLLVNEVLQSRTEPLVLFLDDLHVLDGDAVEDLAYFVDHLPPELHLVLASRAEPDLPLARWRARGMVAELHPIDLEFSAPETERYLNEVLDLGLDPADVAALHDRTQGWPAALSLVAESLMRPAGRASDPDTVDRGSRIDRSVFDYLSQEVLDTLQPDELEFVLAVGVLDELTPEACAAVTDRPDAAQLLEHLERRNLFVTVLDVETPVLRFHDLFREAITRRLARDGPERLQEAHLRAAGAVGRPEKAVRHLLAAEAWEDAAAHLAAHGPDLLQQGFHRAVRDWIRSLPEAVRAAQPRLDLLLGIEAWVRWELERARIHLERAERAFARADDAAGRGEALVFLSHTVHTAGEMERARSLMDAAAACPLVPATRLRLHVQEAWYALSTGRPGEVLESLDAALELAKAGSDPVAVRSLADTLHCHFVGIPGMIDRFERFERLAAPQMGAGDTSLKASVLRLSAWVHEWRGRPDLAEAAATEALAISDRLGDLPSVVLDSGVGHATCMAMAGRHREAETYLGRLDEILRRPELAPFTESLLSVYLVAIGRVRLLQGRIDDARRILARMEASSGPTEWPAAPVARALMHGRLAYAEGRWPDAQAILTEAIQLQQSIRIFAYCDDARILLARLYEASGRADDALTTLEPALAECEADGTPGGVTWHGREALLPLLNLAWERGLHREFVAGLLADLGAAPGGRPAKPTPIEVPSTGEVLSPRELEVLFLVSRGDSNAAIAEALYLSLHTVKRHVANILHKLDSPSRTRAAAVAREIGILT
jgi:LuxR family maltose regulon positive regulatory protein